MQQLSKDDVREPVSESKSTSKISNISFLDTSDYGIKLLGRSVTGEDVILTQKMIDKVLSPFINAQITPNIDSCCPPTPLPPRQ